MAQELQSNNHIIFAVKTIRQPGAVASRRTPSHIYRFHTD
jgi:hypothetical protein